MTFFKQTIKDVHLDNKTVLVRADYNVPLGKNGEISDDLRIRASLPTIKYLINQGCRVAIISHLGRPEGRDAKYSLEPVALRLAEMLNHPVKFVDQVYGDKVKQAMKTLPFGGVVLLENVRFHKEDKSGDIEFAKKIARSVGASYIVKDEFGVAHRSDASVESIMLCAPSVAGLLMEREYTTITKAMKSPQRPLVAILGGAKVSDKIQVIERFVEVADKIIIGGAMANTFLAAKGLPTGASKIEKDQSEVVDHIYAAIKKKTNDPDFLLLPSDVAVAKSIDDTSERTVKSVKSVEDDDISLDIGDETIERYVREIEKAGTVIWNGPLGYTELPSFAHGSARAALALATNPSITSIIGGGDTADFVLKWDARMGGSFTHVSTGGGASLELMAGNRLPGVEGLLDART